MNAMCEPSEEFDGEVYNYSDHLAFFRRTLRTRLGSKRLKNARFEQFGGRFEVVWHNINPIKISVYCE